MSKKNINAYVADEKKREIGDEYIPEDDIPSGSVPVYHRGLWKHLLVRSLVGELAIPDISPTIFVNLLPGALYDALVDTHSPNIFCNKESSFKKWSTFALFAVIFVLIFMLFIMYVTHLK